MGLYSAVLYVHVVATLGLVAALGAEGIALAQLNPVQLQRDQRDWRDPSSSIRVLASICLILLFFSGGYLTDHAGLWKMAWPKIAIGVIVAFGALAGLSSRRLNALRRAHTQTGLPREKSGSGFEASLLRISFSIRAGLVLAAVWLMVAKPNVLDSLGIVLAFVIISWAVAALVKRHASADPASARAEFDHSMR